MYKRQTSGTVSYNGEDVWAENYNRRALRSEVGLVFQYPEHQLFESDVLSDVCFGPMNQGKSREEAEEEAKKALLQVGFKEKNFKKSPFDLSGGQKKRVAIAGVLAMNPKILILDEATAFADPDNEAKVQKAFTKLSAGKTVIMIAHRLSSVVDADCICVLKDGGIVEQGNHETLLAQGGLYAHMWEAYNKSVSWKVGKGEVLE